MKQNFLYQQQKRKNKGHLLALFLFFFSVNFFLSHPLLAAETNGPIDIIVGNIADSVGFFPLVIMAVAYLFGLYLAISAIWRLKNNVENPSSVGLPSVLGRFIGAGFLFSLPIFIDSLIGLFGENNSGDENGIPETTPSGEGVGSVIDNLVASFHSPETFFAIISYLFGIALAIWSIAEFVRTADAPDRNPVRRPIMIAFTAGALMTLPVIMFALKDSIAIGIPGFLFRESDPIGITGTGDPEALDQILVKFMLDIRGPLLRILGLFSWIAGIAFALIGIFRLLRGAQDGAKGPAGGGTIATFIAAAALTSLGDMMGAAQVSLFGQGGYVVTTYATIAYSDTVDEEFATRSTQALRAVLTFVQVVGFYSFVRGIFILRSYAEGDNQASMSSGFTHIIAGAIAVNMTAFMDAVQKTLGLIGFTFP